MTEQDLYRVFDAGGVLSSVFPGYEYREGQLLMSTLVQQSYQQNSILAVEAGTGIGKSFAYLVPALFHAMEHPDERTVVATSTINLQQQLYTKDIPALFKLLDRKCPVALALGRGNYICLRRYFEKIADFPLLLQDSSSDLSCFDRWVKSTESGVIADFPGRITPLTRDEIASDGDLCQGRACPYVRNCFFFKAKREASEANIVISNHHLLFTDASMRLREKVTYDQDGVLPAYSHLIFDEAHNIERNATSYFTELYDIDLVARQMRNIEQYRGKKASMLKQLSVWGDQALYEKILNDLALLKSQMVTLNEYLVARCAQSYNQPFLVTAQMTQFIGEFRQFASLVVDTAGRLESKIRTFAEGVRAPDEYEPMVNELVVRAQRIAAYTQVLQNFYSVEKWGDEIHHVDIRTKRDKSKVVRVKITPFSISDLLVEAVFRPMESVVCTSATLALGNSFEYWGRQVGLPYDDERPFRTAVFSSPFDYKRNLLLLTPQDAPFYTRDNSEHYMEYISEMLYDVICSAEGGTLVLFTSYQMLKAMKSSLSNRFKKTHKRIFYQGDMDRMALLNSFISDLDSSLFATSSFWEGVDAPGHTLRQVVIVKLPFTVPSDPIFKARTMKLASENRSGFFELSVPETTMRLKQGFGRVLRNKEDKGVVLILDSRIVNKSYGIGMIRSLPESFHPDSVSASVCEKIENFLYN